MAQAFIGCAGWALPRDVQDRFPGEGSHLQRYAAQLPVVEINSSFHRPHRHAVYARWAASVPPHFRFAVKLPKTITHVAKLRGGAVELDEFLGQATGLGEHLGCLLVQLPPSLAFEADVAGTFLDLLRTRWAGPVSLEPRHVSWFTGEVDLFLAARRIARVLADPVLHPGGERPGGWDGFAYLRLHGSPRTYYSSYPLELLRALARRLARAAREGQPVWCIFDNTAAGAAAGNALVLRECLRAEPA